MFVTVSGIVTLSKVKHCQNAPLPIVATGSPLVVEGMVTLPPGAGILRNGDRAAVGSEGE
ncbi:MAG: hypothetical protein JWR69_646 [Pedosphaera sp.]|nr:hypothetical protein [Pedosphaera sp.]